MTQGTWRPRLKTMLKERKISMKAASHAIGMNSTFVRDVMAGSSPSVEAFAALADLLGVSLEHLFYGRAR